MKKNLEAIETHYRRYRFRSRMEARWAVFMDQMGIPYVYEPEAFKVAGTVERPPALRPPEWSKE